MFYDICVQVQMTMKLNYLKIIYNIWMVNLNFMHILVSALSKEALETLVKEKGFQYIFEV